MSILNADIVRWAGLTKYVIYRKRGAFDSAHSYTLNIIKVEMFVCIHNANESFIVLRFCKIFIVVKCS